MLRCPACGFESAADVDECQRCHLSVALFGPVQEAAGAGDGNPNYLRAIGEILTAVDATPESPEEPEAPSAGAFARPSRFPALGPRGVPEPPAGSEAGPLAPAGLPALPPAGEVPALLRQVNDYLQIARRQGLDLSDFSERAREGVLSQDRSSLELLSRDLFIHLAASLTEQYEGLLERRRELAGLVSTASQDVELESGRASLALGDLAGAQRRLRHIDDQLSGLEDQWATVQILVAEGDLLATTIRELGGDPEPALGPLTEGKRLARVGDRDAAEPVLARAALALWSLLDPLFLRELARVKEAIVRGRAAGRDPAPAILHLRQLAADLRHRNFAAAIAAYRELRALADGTPPVPAVAG